MATKFYCALLAIAMAAAGAASSAGAAEVRRDTLAVDKKKVVVRDSSDLITVQVFSGSDTLRRIYEGVFTDSRSYERWTLAADGISLPLIDNVLHREPERKRNKHNRRMEGHYAGFGFGLVNLTSGNLAAMTTVDGMAVNPAKCYEWTWNIFDVTLPVLNPYVGLVSGVGLDWRNFRFDGSKQLSQSDSGTRFGSASAGRKYSKSRLRTLHITVPLLLEVQPFRRKGDYYVALGVVGGWNVMTSNRLEWSDNGEEHKDVVKSGWNENPVSLEGVVKLGFGGISVYGKQSLTRLFLQGKGPSVHFASVGLMLDF